MVESYVKTQDREYVYRPCCDGYTLCAKWNEPMFFKVFRTWKDLVKFAGPGAKIAFNVPLTRDIEPGDWEYLESFVVVE